jgi:hypothetical protein
MDEFSQAKKLDGVLTYMANDGNPEFETASEIAKGLKYQEMESIELHLILNKLIKDGFVEFRETKRLFEIPGRKREKITEYIITFEGLYQQQTGGYLQQEKKGRAESIRVDTAIAYQREQADTLNRLTKLVAWGTVGASIIAFLLLLWEIRHVILKISHSVFD